MAETQNTRRRNQLHIAGFQNALKRIWRQLRHGGTLPEASIGAWRFNEKASTQVRVLLDSVGEGIFGLDRDAKVTFVNRAAAELLGWEPTEVAGRPLREIFRHSRTDGSFFMEEDSPIINALRENSKQSGSDHFFSRKDGTNLPVDFVITPVIEGDLVNGAVVSFRDVSARQRAEERLRHVGELQTLHDINLTILDSLDVKPMMDGMLDKVLALGGFDLGMICLVATDRSTLEPIAHRGFRDVENLNHYRERIRQPAGSGLVHQVLATRKIRIVDLRQRAGVRAFRAEGAHSLVVVALRTEREALGVIYLGSRSPRKFLESEINLLDTIGLQIGIAIQKARLFAQAAKKSTELETLARINRDLASQLDNQKLLPLISQEAKKTLQFDRATIWLLKRTLWF